MAKYFHQTILALLAVTLLFFFTACADTLPPPLAITAPPGSDYAFAAVLATQLPEESGWVFNLSLAADSVQALSLVDQQERTLAIVESDLLSDAYQGIDLWADRPTLRHTAVLATLYPLPCVLVVAADNPATFIGAKAGTRLSLGQDSTAITARRLLAASGLDTSQLTLSEEDLKTACIKLKAGELDGFFCLSPRPNPQILALAADYPIKLLSLSAAAQKQLDQTYPYYNTITLTANDYPFLTEELSAAALSATLICNTNLTAAVAYELVRDLYTARRPIAAAHLQGRYLDTNGSLDGLVDLLHPGAAIYYQEQGRI